MHYCVDAKNSERMDMQKNQKLRWFIAVILSLTLFLTGCSVTVSNTQSDTGSEEPYSEVAVDSIVEEGSSSEAAESLKPDVESSTISAISDTTQSTDAISEEGTYTSKEEVALYIHTFGHLPYNYITKKEAKALGWDNSAGNLDEVAPGMSIGGDRFGNYEGSLPEADGRKYFECDVNYAGGYRGAERIIFSNDGLIFYTNDHYKTFEQLY